MSESLHSAGKDAGDFAWAEMLTHQECAAKKHPDWFIDSEHNILCPWCEIDRLKADHHIVYESGLEAVCSCGSHLSIYGLPRSIASVFAEHVRRTRDLPPGSTEATQ